MPLLNYSNILKSIGDGLIVTDFMGKIVFTNPASERLSGWSNNDSIGL
jgi:PAS domain S-box-containing protein